jgi:hypothetical protein
MRQKQTKGSISQPLWSFFLLAVFDLAWQYLLKKNSWAHNVPVAVDP